MIRLLSFAILFLSCLEISFAQSPAFKYQGVARNAQNTALINTNIALRLSILNGSGASVYSEVHSTRTSDLGIFSVNVCQGSNPTGSCNTIDWKAGNFQLKVELDPAGGSNFQNMGNSPILSVPVAAYAASAGSVPGDNDGSVTNELQSLTFNPNNNSLSISSGNNVDLTSLKNDADFDPANEIQQISLDTTNNQVSLSRGGGSFLLPSSGNSLWKKNGNELRYDHTTNIYQSFSPAKLEVSFSNTSKKSFNSATNRWGEEYTTLPTNQGKVTAYGSEIIEYPITLNRHYLRIVSDTMWRASSYQYTFSPGSSPGIITQSEIFSQANNNGSPLRVLSTQLEGSGGIGNMHTHLGGVRAATLGALNIGGVGLTSFIGLYARNNPSSISAGFWFNANGQAQMIAQVKNFVEDHPLNPKKQIWYACVEGPEAAAYERGSAQLVNGVAEVKFSDHFGLMVNPSTVTIQLTPGSADSEGLAVVEKTASGFKVKELRKGTGSYSFDWEVKAIRKGYENFEVIRDKIQVLPHDKMVTEID